MTLIRINHYYDNGAGNNVGDVWSVVNEDLGEQQCRDYVVEQGNETYVLAHNEYRRPTYYMIDDLPDFSDGGQYNYDNCESKDKDGATCKDGCDCCPYVESCYRLQKEQQIEIIKRNGIEL